MSWTQFLITLERMNGRIWMNWQFFSNTYNIKAGAVVVLVDLDMSGELTAVEDTLEDLAGELAAGGFLHPIRCTTGVHRLEVERIHQLMDKS